MLSGFRFGQRVLGIWISDIPLANDIWIKFEPLSDSNNIRIQKLSGDTKPEN